MHDALRFVVLIMLSLCNCRDAVRFRASGPVFQEFLERALAMPVTDTVCHGCPVCDRPFRDDQAFREFEQKVFRAHYAAITITARSC